MAKLILSAFADEYSSDFTKQLQALNRFGIKYLELRGVDGKNISTLSKGEVAIVKEKLGDYGIKVSSIGSPLGKIKLSDDLKSHLETAKRVFETATYLGTNNVRIFSFYPVDNQNEKDFELQAIDGVSLLLKESEKFGVTLCHENEANIYGESPKNCKKLLDYFNGKLKCVFDMGNFVLDGFTPYPDAYQTLKDYVEYFHVKDALHQGAVVPAGKGDAKIKEILFDYKQNSKKDTFITLEPHLQTFDGLNALVGKAFDNPYKYDSQESAFCDAVEKFKELL